MADEINPEIKEMMEKMKLRDDEIKTLKDDIQRLQDEKKELKEDIRALSKGDNKDKELTFKDYAKLFMEGLN